MQSWRRTASRLALAVLVALGRGVTAGVDSLSAEDFKVDLWHYTAALRGSLGSKDNVLLSHTNAQGSAFWMSSAELMVLRLPTDGWQFNFFAEASDLRLFNSPAVDNEQDALAVAQLSKDFNSGWKSTLGINYVFQNQVFDNSANYASQTSVGLIRGHTVAPRWALRKSLGVFWLEAEFSATRQWLDAPLDSYWQLGPRAVLGYGWGRGSELALSYQSARLDYEHREQMDLTGATVTNSALALNTHVLEFTHTQNWDQQRQWQTITTVGVEASFDNGPGFYDYDHYRIAQRLRYRDKRCEVTAQARLSHYAYATQMVNANDAAHRRKTMIGLVLRAERKLTKHLLAHASYNWDRSISNLDFDDYQASTVMGGLALTF